MLLDAQSLCLRRFPLSLAYISGAFQLQRVYPCCLRYLDERHCLTTSTTASLILSLLLSHQYQSYLPQKTPAVTTTTTTPLYLLTSGCRLCVCDVALRDTLWFACGCRVYICCFCDFLGGTRAISHINLTAYLKGDDIHFLLSNRKAD